MSQNIPVTVAWGSSEASWCIYILTGIYHYCRKSSSKIQRKYGESIRASINTHRYCIGRHVAASHSVYVYIYTRTCILEINNNIACKVVSRSGIFYLKFFWPPRRKREGRLQKGSVRSSCTCIERSSVHEVLRHALTCAIDESGAVKFQGIRFVDDGGGRTDKIDITRQTETLKICFLFMRNSVLTPRINNLLATISLSSSSCDSSRWG